MDGGFKSFMMGLGSKVIGNSTFRSMAHIFGKMGLSMWVHLMVIGWKETME
jgi:hypothetical protein